MTKRNNFEVTCWKDMPNVLDKNFITRNLIEDDRHDSIVVLPSLPMGNGTRLLPCHTFFKEIYNF